MLPILGDRLFLAFRQLLDRIKSHQLCVFKKMQPENGTARQMDIVVNNYVPVKLFIYILGRDPEAFTV